MVRLVPILWVLLAGCFPDWHKLEDNIEKAGDGDDSTGGDSGTNSGGDGDGASLGESCPEVCELEGSANCPNDDASSCMGDCLGVAALEGCETEAAAIIGCFLTLSESDLACDTDGESEITGGKCGTEEDALGTCIDGVGGGDGDGDGADSCDDSCGFVDGECDEPDFCDPGTDCTDCS